MADINWTEVFANLTAAAAVSATVIGVVGYIGKSAIEWAVERNITRHKTALDAQKLQAIEELKAEKQTAVENLKADLGQQAKAQDHLSEEIRRWSNPILGSVEALLGRLGNILDNTGYPALSTEIDKREDWNISHEYFLTSTIYLFSQYFCWTQLLREKFSFELFESHVEKDAFFRVQDQAACQLSTWPLPDGAPEDGDRQVFSLQQRQMGESLIVKSNDTEGCMRYAEFEQSFQDPDFRARFEPLERFLTNLSPEAPARWWRMVEMKKELERVKQECRRVLDLKINANAGPIDPV